MNIRNMYIFNYLYRKPWKFLPALHKPLYFSLSLWNIAKLQINSKNLPTLTQFNLNSLVLKSIFRRWMCHDILLEKLLTVYFGTTGV